MIGALVVLFFVFVTVPVTTLYAINTLVGSTIIDINVGTWLAALWLMMLLASLPKIKRNPE